VLLQSLTAIKWHNNKIFIEKIDMNNKRNFFLIIILLILMISLYNIFQSNNKLDKKVVVFAASSLKPVLDNFFVENKDNVIVQYNGSQFLKHQLENGAKADFLFCATAEKCLSDFNKQNFCSNDLILAINKNLNLFSIDDVINSNIKLASASQNVPLGMITNAYLDSISAIHSEFLRKKLTTFDLSASAVIARLLTEQVDGAFIYTSYFNNDEVLQKNFLSIDLFPNQKLVYFYQQLQTNKKNNTIMQELQLMDKSLCNQFGYRE
tara:strand:+ start:1405 stop:2199 length:795 start_codon:yes stop_codon:yes gene_type:complete